MKLRERVFGARVLTDISEVSWSSSSGQKGGRVRSGPPNQARELGRLAGLMGTRRAPNALVGALGIVGVVLLGSSAS